MGHTWAIPSTLNQKRQPPNPRPLGPRPRVRPPPLLRQSGLVRELSVFLFLSFSLFLSLSLPLSVYVYVSVSVSVCVCVCASVCVCGGTLACSAQRVWSLGFRVLRVEGWSIDAYILGPLRPC